MNQEQKENQGIDQPETASSIIDEAMLPMSGFVAEMADLDGYIMEEQGSFSMDIQKVEMGLPVQLDIQVDDNGKVILGGAPPLYYFETTFMPVFHQVELHLEAVNKDKETAD